MFLRILQSWLPLRFLLHLLEKYFKPDTIFEIELYILYEMKRKYTYNFFISWVN
jgi:hypothetical protein